jgi:hypothetical protein
MRIIRCLTYHLLSKAPEERSVHLAPRPLSRCSNLFGQVLFKNVSDFKGGAEAWHEAEAAATSNI